MRAADRHPASGSGPGPLVPLQVQDLVVGSRSLARLLLYETVVTLFSWVPGALGLVLRKLAYPCLLGASVAT